MNPTPEENELAGAIYDWHRDKTALDRATENRDHWQREVDAAEKQLQQTTQRINEARQKRD